jgi:hypothetical protein
MLRVSLKILGRRWGSGASAQPPVDPAEPEAPDPFPLDFYLDTLELTTAVIGSGVILGEVPEGGFILYAVSGCRARVVGWYPTAAEAWRAVDAIDDGGRRPRRRVSRLLPS